MTRLGTLEDMLVKEESKVIAPGLFERSERVLESACKWVDFLLLNGGRAADGTAEEPESMEDKVGALTVPFTWSGTCKGDRWI